MNRAVVRSFAALELGVCALLMIFPVSTRTYAQIAAPEPHPTIVLDRSIVAKSVTLRQEPAPAIAQAVVMINASIKTSDEKPIELTASGFVVATSERFVWIATARHVVDAGSNVVPRTVTFCCSPAGTRWPIQETWRSLFGDVALVSVVRSPKMRFAKVALVQPASIHDGDAYLVVGHPLGKSWVTTRGLVLRKPSRLVFPRDASPIWAVCPTALCGPGDSGAPMLIRGRLAGLVARGGDPGVLAIAPQGYPKQNVMEIEPADEIFKVLQMCGDSGYPECHQAALTLMQWVDDGR